MGREPRPRILFSNDVAWRAKLRHGWPNPEAVGFDGATKPGDRLDHKNPRTDTQVVLQLLGGPLDGNKFRVPAPMLQERGEVVIPFTLPETTALIIPNAEKHAREALYRLDRGSRVLRFTTVRRRGG